MNWDGDDIDVFAGHKVIYGANPKLGVYICFVVQSIAKQGRRAGKSILSTPETPSNNGEDNPPEVRGGWAEDGKRSAR